MKMGRGVLTVALLLGASGAAQAGGSVSGGIGWRQLAGGDWHDIGADSQPALGVMADIELGHSPLYASVSGQVSASDTDDDVIDDGAVAVFDLAIGLKLMARQGLFRPYAEAGLTSTGVAISYDDDYGDDHDDSDQSYGYFAGFGGQFHIARHFVAGIDARWVLGTGKLEFDGPHENANSFVAMASFGFAWGE